MKKIITALRNRKKLILGVAAYVVIYAFNRIVLNADDTQAHGTALVGAGIAVERAGPIFGINVNGPKVTEDDEVVVETKTNVGNVKVDRTKKVADIEDVKK